jgi:hypothetical protein
MAAKKTPTGKAKTSRPAKKAVRVSYVCPNPKRPYSLLEIVAKIVNDRDFARFIRRLLCQANKGNKEAQACVDSYFNTNEIELGKLCIPKENRQRFLQCTDQNRLIDAIAYYYGQN